MLDRGAITKEQADELLGVLSEEPEGGEGDPTAGAGDTAEEVPGGRFSHDYGYEWVRRHRGPRSRNAQDSSFVEQPEGEEFEFEGNRVVHGKIIGMRLTRSKVKDNRFNASVFRDAVLVDSAMEDCALSGASLAGLSMEGSRMRVANFAGSKVGRLELQGGSELENVRFMGCTVQSLSCRGESGILNVNFAGGLMNSLALASRSRMRDCRMSGVTSARLTMERSLIHDTKCDGCGLTDVNLSSVEMDACTLRGVSVHGATLENCRMLQCRVEAMAFENLRIRGDSLERVRIEGPHFPCRLQTMGMEISDCTWDDMKFEECTFQDTAFLGIESKGLRFRGVDFTGRKIEKAEDLEDLANG